MTLFERYVLARWCYSIGEDYISDFEYRDIEGRLKVEMPDNEYINRSWSDDPCPIDLLEKYNLMQYYRDIKFVHKSESIRSIIDEATYKAQFFGINKRTRVSYKIDGFNIQVNYYNGGFNSAETRGRTGNALNANVVRHLVPDKISYKGKVKITGELSIPNDKWKLYQLETGNSSQRNSVSTALARGDINVLAFLAFNIQIDGVELDGDIYDILNKLGFKTPMCMYVDSFDKLDKAIDLMGKRNKVYNYLTDGLVIENTGMQVALRIREWKEESLKSYVVGYTENTGVYHDSMVVDVSPVVVDGRKNSKVNVTNLQYIMNNNLRIGYPIAFNIRSAANCVLNETRTKELQEEWEGRYEEFRDLIDAK